jgi:hypothetical protein
MSIFPCIVVPTNSIDKSSPTNQLGSMKVLSSHQTNKISVPHTTVKRTPVGR